LSCFFNLPPRFLSPVLNAAARAAFFLTFVMPSEQSAYNAWVDRLNAIRLLEALVAAGANSRAPMANTWVHNIALRDMSLQGTDLASAIAYAEGEGWLADSSRKGWVSLTRAGGVVAKVK
jgi:hypothetical protein